VSEFGAKLVGLEEALKAMQAAFPGDIKKQQRLLNGAMSGAARKSILPMAKQLAKRGDSSGALSESLNVRAMGRRKRAGKAAGMEVVPVRSNLKALAKYIQFYYTSRGKAPPSSILTSGIRHGHLVEFGTAKTSAFPFLWPAAQAQASNYKQLFALFLKKRIEAAVRKAAKK